MTELARINRFLGAIEEACATRTQEFDWGKAYFHSDFPIIYDLNFLRVEKPGATAAELAAAADELLGGAGLAHRKVSARDHSVGEGLSEGFAELGWSITSLLAMIHRKPPALPAKSLAFETDFDSIRPVVEEIRRRGATEGEDSSIDPLVEMHRVFNKAGNGRCFAAEADGSVAAVCYLYSLEGVGQIESIDTLEEYRNRGLASALVMTGLEASQAAGNDLTFLLADYNDWPKELYARLGFEPAGMSYDFLKRPKLASNGC